MSSTTRTVGSGITAGGTVGGQVLKWSKEDPERVAYIFRGTQPGNQRVVLTRHDVLALSSCFAAVVREAGIKKGDVVCNTLPNSPERIVTDIGLMMAGVVAMNGMVFLADGKDLAKSLARSGSVAIVVNPEQPENALEVLGDCLVVRGDNAQCRDAPNLRKVILVDCGGGSLLRPYIEQLKIMDKRFTASATDDITSSDTAFVFTTSGTSGFSKLVPRTHKQFISLGLTFGSLIELEPDDIIFNDRSLGWLGGCCFTYVSNGSTRVLVDMTVPPQDILAFMWECMIAENCTIVMMVPVHISWSLAKTEYWKNKGSKIRILVTGGMPLTKQQLTAVGTLSKNIIVTYASTEGGFITSHKLTEFNKEAYEDGDNGKPVPGYTIKIMSDKGQEILPSQAGKSGEIWSKGPQVFCGYLGSGPEEHKGLFTEDNWFKTSDVGFYNLQGNIHVVCRKSNAIMHGAYIIYPGWLEKKMESCPGVKHVMIVPVPDPVMYQEMCACVVPAPGYKLTEEDIVMFCDKLYSSESTQPKPIPKYYVFFPSFPMQPSGNKPDRKKIFAIALDKLNLAGSNL